VYVFEFVQSNASCATRGRLQPGTKTRRSASLALYLSEHQDFGRFADATSRSPAIARPFAAAHGRIRSRVAAGAVPPSMHRGRSWHPPPGACVHTLEQRSRRRLSALGCEPDHHARLCSELWARLGRGRDWSLVGTHRVTWPQRLGNFDRLTRWNGFSSVTVWAQRAASAGAGAGERPSWPAGVSIQATATYDAPGRLWTSRITASRFCTDSQQPPPIPGVHVPGARPRGMAAASATARIVTT